MKKLILLLFILPVFQQLSAQNFAINTDGSTANPSALLDVKSTSQGVLVPRMSKVQKNAITSPATGLLIFQSTPDSIGFHYYDGTKWTWLANSAVDSSWKINGNSNITSAKFIGTLNDTALRFRIKNIPSGFIDSTTESTALGFKAIKTSTAIGNTGIGYKALDSTTSGYWNTAVGHNAMGYNTTGYDNTATGNDVMHLNKSGIQNAAYGAGALRDNDSGNANVAVGRASLISNKKGSNNTVIGTNAMFNNLNSNNNTAIGYSALVNHKSNNENTSVGMYTSYYDTTGFANTALGYFALAYNTKGQYNIGIGWNAMSYNDSTDFSVGVGANAGYWNRRDGTVAVGTNSLFYNTYGSNTFPYASTDLTKAIHNTAVGHQSMYYNTLGSRNTALGYNAMVGAAFFNPNTVRNVAVGDSALAGNFGAGNVAVGTVALGKNSAYYNTAVGDSAMGLAANSDNNDAFGQNALKTLKSGGTFGSYWNTSIGSQSMEFDTTSYATVAVGFRALRNPTKSYESTALGVGAMEFGDSAYYNTAVGRAAMFHFGKVSNSVSVGAWSMSNAVSGTYNTAVGYVAMEQDSTASNNVAIGTSALRNNKFSNNNTAVGLNAGYYALGTGTSGQNTYIGMDAGFGVISTSTGTDNTGVGYFSLKSNTIGQGNVAVGSTTFQTNSSGSWNTAVGSYALNASTTSDGNTAVGHRALNGSVTGIDNVGVGFYSLVNSNGASNNTAIGTYSGYNNTSGTGNTLLGYYATPSIGTLTNATAIGMQAYVAQSNSMVLGSINGVNGATSDTKVGIGTTAPDSLFSVADNFMVNKNGEVQYANGVNNMMYMFTSSGGTRMVVAHSPAFTNWGLQYDDPNDRFNFIGSGNNVFSIGLASRYVGVNRIATSGSNVGTFQIQNVSISDDQLGIYNSSTGNRWTYYVSTDLALYFNGTYRGAFNNATGNYAPVSDRRFKKDITEFNYGLATVNQLKPYKYRYLDNKSTDPLIPGFMAQDVLKVYPEAVYKKLDKEGKEFYTLDYQSFSSLSIKAIQELSAQNEELKKKNDQLEKDMKLIKAKLGITE